MTAYQKTGAINRTVFRGALLWPADRQALPPWAWCPGCGAEIYGPGRRLCRRCRKTQYEERKFENGKKIDLKTVAGQ